MGATVIVTTRFPHDAADRYAKEVDASFFSERLHIYGIDFRDVAMVHGFCSQIKLSFSRLDVIINNAAQTVRKPPKFYEHLLEAESRPVNIGSGKAAHVVDVYKQNGGNYLFLENSSDADVKDSENSVGFSASNSIRSFANVNTSAALSQVHFMQVDGEENNDALFPQGRLDRDDQQVDLRSENSWLLELGQVSTVEMLECHVINVFTPWILISELKSIMQATNVRPDGADKRCDKYIVNVSAMEGQFYRPKTIYHPHSNMAKAGLNMMTRTAAAGFAEISIFMTAVDTGWITDENPVDQWHKRENAPPPLDEFDAAMRVLDPVIEGMEGKEPVWGVFLKNYHATRW